MSCAGDTASAVARARARAKERSEKPAALRHEISSFALRVARETFWMAEGARKRRPSRVKRDTGQTPRTKVLRLSWPAIFCHAAFLAYVMGCVASFAFAQSSVVPMLWDLQQRAEKPDVTLPRQIRFVTADDYPPFNFILPDGTLSGFNVDLARAVQRAGLALFHSGSQV